MLFRFRYYFIKGGRFWGVLSALISQFDGQNYLEDLGKLSILNYFLYGSPGLHGQFGNTCINQQLQSVDILTLVSLLLQFTRTQHYTHTCILGVFQGSISAKRFLGLLYCHVGKNQSLFYIFPWAPLDSNFELFFVWQPWSTRLVWKHVHKLVALVC